MLSELNKSFKLIWQKKKKKLWLQIMKKYIFFFTVQVMRQTGTWTTLTVVHRGSYVLPESRLGHLHVV